MSRRERLAGDGAAPAARARRRRRDQAWEVRHVERVGEALRLRAAGYGYQRIADTMGVGLATAHGLVMEAIAAIPAEQAEEIRRLVLDQCDQLMQRLMPLLEEAPLDVLDHILQVQARVLQLHDITGGIGLVGGRRGDDDGGGEESDALLIGAHQGRRAGARALGPGAGEPNRVRGTEALNSWMVR